jgi:hypothetical protein
VSVVLLAEGDTERALKEHLKAFLDQRAILEGKQRTKLLLRSYLSLRKDKLSRQIQLLLDEPGVEAVVALIDVFPNFADAAEAKAWLRGSTDESRRFFAHAAQFDVEAWLLPYWDDICRRLKLEKRRPSAHPEHVNGHRPPAYHLDELYRQAKPKARKYNKPIEMREVLRGKDLTVAADACPEFKSLLNTLLALHGLAALG